MCAASDEDELFWNCVNFSFKLYKRWAEFQIPYDVREYRASVYVPVTAAVILTEQRWSEHVWTVYSDKVCMQYYVFIFCSLQIFSAVLLLFICYCQLLNMYISSVHLFQIKTFLHWISFIFIVHILYVYPDDLYTGVEGIKYEIIVSNNEILPLMPYKHFHFRQDDV